MRSEWKPCLTKLPRKSNFISSFLAEDKFGNLQVGDLQVWPLTSLSTYMFGDLQVWQKKLGF